MSKDWRTSWQEHCKEMMESFHKTPNRRRSKEGPKCMLCKKCTCYQAKCLCLESVENLWYDSINAMQCKGTWCPPTDLAESFLLCGFGCFFSAFLDQVFLLPILVLGMATWQAMTRNIKKPILWSWIIYWHPDCMPFLHRFQRPTNGWWK